MINILSDFIIIKMQNIPLVTSSYISPEFNGYVSKGPLPMGYKNFIESSKNKELENAVKNKNDRWFFLNYINNDTCIDYYMAKNVQKIDWDYFEVWWTKFCKIMDSGGLDANNLSEDGTPINITQGN